ncbi:MAG: glycine cleavage system protein GcvH, partial [Thermoguttaceae bacterium]
MTARFITRPWRWILVVALIASVFAAGPITQQAQAGKLDELGTSLNLVPDDAAFYSASLRMGEQIETIRGSRAWAKLTSMPLVQMGLAIYTMQAANPQSVPGQLKAAWDNPETRKSIDLLLDMGSQEIFCYGDKDLGDTILLLQQIAGAMRYGPLMMQLSGGASELSQEERQAMMMFGVLSENLELLKIPTMVMGFKLSDTDRATEQLALLEQLATPRFEAEPMLKGRLKRTKVDGHEYLTLSLDGKMIPWDEVPTEKLKEIETTEGDTERLIARIKEMTLVVALGVRDDYLLLSVGASTDCLASLGQGTSLADRPELKPLEKFAEERLVSIAYLSEDIARRISSGKDDIDGLVEFAQQGLQAVDELNDDQKQRILKDIGALAEEIKSAIPEPGPIMAFSFLTEQGIEGYQYNWTEQAGLDGSKPLTILQHLGGDPLIAMAGRGVQSPEAYDSLVKWVKVGYGYFKDFAVPEMSERDRKQYDQTVELFTPLVERLDKANRDLMIPAFADGQVALVVDRKLRSKQFVKGLPGTDEPMPMLEPALVLGVSDAELARRGCQEYLAVADGVIEAIREIEPGGIRPMQPADLKYARSHEWVAVDGEIATVGISDFAVKLLTDLVYIELPQSGSVLSAGDVFGEVESVKAVSDLYAPIGGEVIEVNQPLADDLAVLSDDPYGDGWVMKLRVGDSSGLDALFDRAAYEKYCADE